MKRYRVHIRIGKSKFIATTMALHPAHAREKALAHIQVTEVEEAPDDTIEQDPDGIWHAFDDLFGFMDNVFGKRRGARRNTTR